MLWTLAPQPLPELADHDIHIYYVSLDEGDSAAFERMLSEDEHARASRFRFAVHRQRFIARRAILRQLLKHYIKLLPAQFSFNYTPHGKPYLENQSLQFNLSDSEHLALYAFAQTPIGIDIESVHMMDDMDDVARLMFSPAENVVYRALPIEQKAEGFFNCWTRKEAFIKAVGEGLSYPLADFDVTLKPDEPAKMLRIRDDMRPDETWSLVDLHPAANFRGALAMQGRGWKISCFQLS
jgi:4'-phosphopantetheinyl transferase